MIELREHEGRNIATGKPQKTAQYRVFADGKPIGFIAWHDGAPLCLTTRFGPIEREQIEKEVATLKKQRIGTTSQAPDVPPEMLEQQKEEGVIDFDDFDEG